MAAHVSGGWTSNAAPGFPGAALCLTVFIIR
jgi:hypothetical protein